jgi:D-beta-D-heptose 7-phosphate kinase/D-beta-D-heptose 1-phosphate adenosyltransferase
MEKVTIVYAYVVADILHEGHVLFLENAKKLGDKLIVGVLTDRAVMERKPEPVMSFPQRLGMVKALKCVDCAVAQDAYSPLGNVKEINPDILIESSDHLDKPANDYMESIGGRVVSLPYYPGNSSTDLKEKITRNFLLKQLANPNK